MNQDRIVQPALAQSLAEAHSRAESGYYKEALALVKEAKSLQPRNVYILAFERQMEQLIELSDARIITEEQRSDILDSIPGIIDRALDGGFADGTHLTAAKTPNVRTEVLEREEREKTAALDWLRDQYFQHAHEYVNKGQYDNALAEIRRIFIIEPGNQTAKDFEDHIVQLRAIRRSPPAPSHPAITAPPKQVVQTALHVDGEPLVVMAEEWSSPQHAVREETAAEPPKEAGTRKGKWWMAIVTVILIAILGFVIYSYWTMQRKAKRPTPDRVPSFSALQQDSYVSDGALVAERSYVVTEPGSGPAKGPAEVTEEKNEGASQEKRAPAEPLAEAKAPEGTADQDQLTAKETRGAEREAFSPTSHPSPSPATRSARPARSPVQPTLEERTEETVPANSFVAVEKPPEIVKMEKPQFPASHTPSKLEGQVVVQVQIGPDGKPLQARVLKSTNSLLNSGVVDAVMKSEYSPAQMSSGPVTAWMSIPFSFKTN